VLPIQQKFIIKAQNGRYLIDGVQAPELELISGKEYSFDLSDSSLSSHPLAFKIDGQLWKESVTATGTLGVDQLVKITVPSASQGVLSYYCTNHSGMGNDAKIVANKIFGTDDGSRLDGLSGDDVIEAGTGDDTLDGGAGDDALDGDSGDDIIIGGMGDDYLTAGDGNDRLFGGDGDDALHDDWGGNDHFDGGEGTDSLFLPTKSSGASIDVQAGTVKSTFNPPQWSETPAQDEVDTFESIEIFGGTSYGDTFVGSEGDETFYGFDGNDTLTAGDGDDILSGGAGDDTIILESNGAFGSDLFAYNVKSSFQTGTEESINLDGKSRFGDFMDGGADVDTVELTDGSDAFFLHDSFSGFHSSLTLVEDYDSRLGTARIANIENINSGLGDDIVDLTSPNYSLEGQDITVDGGSGNDTLWGSDANETLKGGVGDDVLFGGAGTNVLTGGADADVFQFTGSSTNDTVKDFSLSDGDTLRFFNKGGAQFDRSSVSLNNAGDELSISDGAEVLTITLEGAGLQLADLGSDVLIIG